MKFTPPQRRPVTLALAGVLAAIVFAPPAVAQDKPANGPTFPTPSRFPVSWELKFEHGLPQRVVVDLPGASPKAYYYIAYTVTNVSDKELTFLPILELLTRDGQVIRSDNKVPPQVFKAIKDRERNGFLETQYAIGGDLRLGPDQAREAVAIWPEPAAEMGTFSIFVGGLSGEFTFLTDAAGQEAKDPNGKPIILRKTLQLNYLVRGDEVYPGEDAINENPEEWVMR